MNNPFTFEAEVFEYAGGGGGRQATEFDELDEHEMWGSQSPSGRDFEFEQPQATSRPAANAVDADAAEPIFNGRVRLPLAPLLDAATLKLSIQWNEAAHPKVSGITIAELCARLEQYIDRASLDDLVRRANVGATSPYGSDKATVATLLAHQFQRKTCRTPTVGDITRPCTTNGRIAQDTLDALGFVYHSGTTLNAVDRANAVANKTLGKLSASSFSAVAPGLTAKTWWSYMVSPPWLGMPIKNGIHLVLLKRLRDAQRALMRLPAYAGMNPAELGLALGINEEHKGARPGNTAWSMHLFGLAIDIGYTRNPWVRTTARVAQITLRAARLLGPSGAASQGISAQWLHSLALAHRDTARIHKILAEWTRWLGEYFALAGNAKRLEGLLPTANVIYPDGGWFKQGESLAEAARRWTQVVRTDFADFANAVARGTQRNEVRHGFMDLARDLVIALRDDACLAWGAVDFGARVSGDIMHFDCRVDGIGRAIASEGTYGNPHVPSAGHSCVPTTRAQAVQREYEQYEQYEQPTRPTRPTRPAQPVTPTPPQTPANGHWMSFTSSVIPSYKGATGRSLSTPCAVYVSDAALREKTIDLLVFFQGDVGPCTKTFDPDPKNTRKKFSLDAQIHRTGRKVVLAVPTIHWIVRRNDNVLGAWTAANLNKFVEEVLDEMGKQLGWKPLLGNLILVGHSHAYAIFTPLACEFDHNVPATKTGALARLDEVWALDTTYSQTHVRSLDVWARKLPKRRFIAVLNEKSNSPPLVNWKNYYGKNDYCPYGFKPAVNLSMCTVPYAHCDIPSNCISQMLLTPKGTRPC